MGRYSGLRCGDDCTGTASCGRGRWDRGYRDRSATLSRRRQHPMIRVVLAQPRGFCAGVERAIEIVERALEKYGPPIYVRHEIVHNRHVGERLPAKGAHFVDEIDEIPKGSVTIFSAHGFASAIEERATDRGLPVI